MNIYKITDFGAKGDCICDDTEAIQSAIDKCADNGGGTVLVPGPGIFISRQLELTTNITLLLDDGAILKSTGGKNDFPLNAFLYARNAKNISITGRGTIDGSGELFISEKLPHIYRAVHWRPHTIKFVNCKNVRFSDFTLKDSAQWAMHIVGCNDVNIRGLSIYNDLRMPNSDGIDVDNSKNIRISDCHIESGDDAICPKSSAECAENGPCENIVVTNCTLVSTSCAIKLGSGPTVGIRDMIVSNCIIKASNRGIGIQLRDSGNMENIIFSNCIIETRLFHDDWWGKAEPIYVTAIPRNKGTVPGNARNIRFSNILCKGPNGVFVQGTPELENVSLIEFNNVQIEIIEPEKYQGNIYDRRPCEDQEFLHAETSGFRIENAQNIILRNSQVIWKKSKKNKDFEFINCKNVTNV
ncbi:MAG: glycosyl hydrolase family 28 protein [Candidatus Nanoarchaeia archaeon]